MKGDESFHTRRKRDIETSVFWGFYYACVLVGACYFIAKWLA